MKKTVKINYLGKDIEKSHNSEFEHGGWRTIEVEGVSTKRYHNSIALLVQLSKCARILLDFLVEQMDKNNLVNNNNLLKKEFNKLLKKTGQEPYGNVTINKAFAELSDKEILKGEYYKRGTYQVNPVFFFNGSDAARIKAVRDLQELPNADWAREVREKNYKKKED